MGNMMILARRIGEPLRIEAWPISSCSCGCNSSGRKMLPFGAIVDGEVTVINSVAPSSGRIVWLALEKRFVMELTTDGNTEYYASWKGHSAYQPENYDKYVYYISDGGDENSWEMFTVGEDGDLKQVATSDCESLTNEDIDEICKTPEKDESLTKEDIDAICKI